MVAYGRPPSSQAVLPEADVHGLTRQDEPVARLSIAAIALTASIGVLVASAAFAAGRLGYANSAWANRAYWLGQALVLIPIAARLLGRPTLSSGSVVKLIVILTVAQYILKICYSPAGFTFADELYHWRGTVNLVQTGDPFTPNYGIPIGPHYPGLELATSALISCTGLSVFSAGLIIIGLAHLLFVCTLYLVFGTLTRSHRIAGIAVLIYYSTPDFTSFNSMFVYETLALAFLGLSLLAALKVTVEESPGIRIRWYVIGVLSISGTVITHHVTSYALTVSLVLVTLVSAIAGFRSAASRLCVLASVCTSMVAVWFIFVAPDTANYFRPTVQGVLDGLNGLLGGGSAGAPSTSLAPLGDQFLEGVGILIITCLLMLGTWDVWRRHRQHPWILAMTIGSFGWFVALAVRLTTPDGQELAGRTAPFVDIPVSVIAALALIRFVNAASLRRWRSGTIAVVTAGALTLLFDGLANGWPPYWERLPGPHQVAGFERSVGPEEIATADWTLSALGPGNLFAADIGIDPVLAGYGYQNPLQSVGYLYTTPTFTSALALRAEKQGVHYILVDRRLSESLPSSGTYFAGQTSAVRRPIPLPDLTKFDDVPSLPRVYDSGNIVIYNLQGPGYAP